MLEDAAGGGGGCSGDRDGVGLGGEGEGVRGVDAVSAAGGEEQGEAEEGESEEPCCDAMVAGAKSQERRWEIKETPR